MKFGDSQLIESVLEIVRKRFGVPVILQTESFDFNGGHDPARNQTNSNWILKQLLDRFPSSQSKILGLTERDLYCPVLTYVFGEAALGGQVAVVSSHRFHNELYGLGENREVLKSRLLSEVVHELGHTFGLIHCQYQGCVMYPSTYVEDIDIKPNSFCDACSQFLSDSVALQSGLSES